MIAGRNSAGNFLATSMSNSPLVLAEFLPYRLSVLANRISRELSRLYADRFDLGITQWRVLAVLGLHPGISADEVCRHTELDKVAVSRAVQHLRDKKLVSRRLDTADRRKSVLKLTSRGQSTYQRIVPQARRYEQQLRANLAAGIRQDLDACLSALDRATQRDLVSKS